MLIGRKIRLRPKSLTDAHDDYAWQTDPELAHLDAVLPLNMTFPQYLAEYARKLRYPALTKHPFAIETLEGKHIGNCVYFDTNDKDDAELGIMIGNREYWNKGYGTDAVGTLVGYIFRKTKFHRIRLKTLETNSRAQKCFKKCGFIPFGHLFRNGYNFILMELTRKKWQAQQKESEVAGKNF